MGISEKIKRRSEQGIRSSGRYPTRNIPKLLDWWISSTGTTPSPASVLAFYQR